MSQEHRQRQAMVIPQREGIFCAVPGDVDEEWEKGNGNVINGRRVGSHEDTVPVERGASSLSWPPRRVGVVWPLLC